MLAVIPFDCSLTLVINRLFVSDKNHGVILIPEGIVESIPELYALLKVLISTGKHFYVSFQYVLLINRSKYLHVVDVVRCRKFMDCLRRVCMLIIFLLSCHLGHLLCLRFCLHSSRNRFNFFWHGTFLCFPHM